MPRQITGSDQAQGEDRARVAPTQCDPKLFASLLRSQGALLPCYVKLAWFLFVVTIFAAMAISETAHMDDQQQVLEATKTAIEGHEWDSDSVLADVADEADIYKWLTNALLPLLQSSQSQWYVSNAYNVVGDEQYQDALARKPQKDPLPDAGYPIWDAKLGEYVLPAVSRVRKYNTAGAVRLQQIRGERTACATATFMSAESQTKLMGECFLQASETTATPDWDGVCRTLPCACRCLRQSLLTHPPDLPPSRVQARYRAGA